MGSTLPEYDTGYCDYQALYGIIKFTHELIPGGRSLRSQS